MLRLLNDRVTQRSLRYCVAVAIVSFAGRSGAVAQAPAIARTTPQAVAPGQTADITVTGSNLTGATSLWTSFGEPAALAPDVENNGQDAGRAVFRVSAPAP